MKLDHIGIAVKSIEASLRIWRDMLGLDLVEIKEVPLHGVKIAVLHLGNTNIELLEPLGEQSAVLKSIKDRGEGLHHICFEVDDIAVALKKLKENGIKLIDEMPRKGAEAGKVAFIHPRDMGGVLIELCQY
jgi:methylmalonyl-CoA/ethylmalonyl-CoA epimerase